MKSKDIENIKFTLSGDLLMIDFEGQERLLSLEELIDDFKKDMNVLKERDDTDTELVFSMQKGFIDGLSKLHDYAKKHLSFEEHEQDRIIH